MTARCKIVFVLGFFVIWTPLYGASLEKLTDWKAIQKNSEQRQIPVVLVIEQTFCTFCEQLKEEVLDPVLKRDQIHEKAIFRYILIDDGETFIDQSDNVVRSLDFAQRFNFKYTPTVFLLDDNARELASPLVGYSGGEYYLYFLEEAIASAQSLIDSRL